MYRDLMGDMAKGAFGILSALFGILISHLSDVKELLQVIALFAAIVASVLTSASLYIGLREKISKPKKKPNRQEQA